MRVPWIAKLRFAAGRYLPFLKLAPNVDRQAAFRLRPVRNSLVEWDRNTEGEALLRIPLRERRFSRILSAIVAVPKSRSIQLDEVGTFVWALCDGSNTVESIVQKTCAQYKMNRREVELSVTAYLQMLAERNLIGFYEKARGTK
ncbi:MAG: PqqD family protein [Chthonomonadales bacterium]